MPFFRPQFPSCGKGVESDGENERAVVRAIMSAVIVPTAYARLIVRDESDL